MLNHFSKISKATKRDFDWGPHPVWLETYLAISHPILGLRALIVHGKKTSAQFDEWNILTEIHGIYIYIYMDLWLLDAKKDAKKHHDHPKIYWAS